MRALALRSRPPEWGEDSPVVDARLLGIFDLSGSMSAQDAGEEGNQRRVDVLKSALDELVESFPNQIAAVGFNTDAFSLRLDMPLKPDGTTNLYGALRFASSRALSIRNVVLVSDGQPTDGKERESTDLVRQWKGLGIKFSVVYCGPKGDAGEKFLQQLAREGGGKFSRSEVKVHLLVDALERVLLAAPKGRVIQL